MTDDIDWKALAKKHPDALGYLEAVGREMRRLHPHETDPDVMRDRLAGGSTDQTANYFADHFHDRLRKFSVPELIDMVVYLAGAEINFEESEERIADAIDTVLLTRYMNRHPEELGGDE